MSKSQPEYHLQVQICTYLRAAYPTCLFLSDTVASVYLTGQQQLRNKAIQCSKFACPDLLILEPRGKYHGLMIELKVDSPYLKNGSLPASPHIRRQAETLTLLQGKGYMAYFSAGFNATKALIDDYMKLTK